MELKHINSNRRFKTSRATICILYIIQCRYKQNISDMIISLIVIQTTIGRNQKTHDHLYYNWLLLCCQLNPLWWYVSPSSHIIFSGYFFHSHILRANISASIIHIEARNQVFNDPTGIIVTAAASQIMSRGRVASEPRLDFPAVKKLHSTFSPHQYSSKKGEVFRFFCACDPLLDISQCRLQLVFNRSRRALKRFKHCGQPTEQNGAPRPKTGSWENESKKFLNHPWKIHVGWHDDVGLTSQHISWSWSAGSFSSLYPKVWFMGWNSWRGGGWGGKLSTHLEISQSYSGWGDSSITLCHRWVFGARAAHIWFELNSPAYMFSILVFLLCFKRQCRYIQTGLYFQRMWQILEVFWSYSNFENSSITQCHAIKVQYWVCTWCCIGELIHSTALMVSFRAFILSAN